jgi:hypothetical protein
LVSRNPVDSYPIILQYTIAETRAELGQEGGDEWDIGWILQKQMR